MFKRRNSFLRPVLFSICLILLWCLAIIAERVLIGPFFDIAQVRAVQLATEAVNRTIQQEVSGEKLQYTDFVAIEKDGQGHVTLIQANTVKVNQVAAETTLSVQKALEDMEVQSFELPLGLVLQTPFFANYGPRIKVNVYPVGTVRAKIIGNFESAGINQTRHSIHLSFDTNVRIVIPAKSGDALVATQVPLAESIIVGIVPTTYVSLPEGLVGSAAFK